MAAETSSRTAALEQQAVDCARRGDFGPDARALNEELTRLSPANAGAWTRLARCCMELGQLDAAETAADAALRLNPANTIARNLQADVSRRRMGPVPPAVRRRPSTGQSRSSAASSGTRKSQATGLAGLGAQDFTTLGHMPASAAADALEPRLEPLLMALNERPFAHRVVEARNRAGQAANALYRRSTLQGGPDGHLYVFHYGGRWEPQMNIGLFAAPQWGRSAIRAGIGFNLSEPSENERAGVERALDYYARFQHLVSSTWRQLLTAWMRASGGFIQYGDNRPATEMLPADAVSWLVNVQNPAAVGWIFCGSWLFADAPDHAAVLADGRQLVSWLDRTFTDLLPLWTTVFRP